MLELAGIAYAMENADEKAKAVATEMLLQIVKEESIKSWRTG